MKVITKINTMKKVIPIICSAMCTCAVYSILKADLALGISIAFFFLMSFLLLVYFSDNIE